MQLTTAELNKVCVKLPPGPINPPLSPPLTHTIQQQNHDETQMMQHQQQQDPTDQHNISLINISGIGETVVQATMITAVSSPVNLAK